MFLVCTHLHIAIPFIFWLLHVLQISISGKVVYASEDKIFHKYRPTPHRYLRENITVSFFSLHITENTF